MFQDNLQFMTLRKATVQITAGQEVQLKTST